MAHSRPALTIVLFVAAFASPACRESGSLRDDHGIAPCPATVANDLLSPEALQCWLTAPHGRWRILSHQEVFGALVAEVEAHDPADAEEIARRFVEGKHEALSEISIYVQSENATPARVVRRIRWTSTKGYETLEFTAPSER